MTNPTTGRHASPAHRRADDRNRAEFRLAIEDWGRWRSEARRAERLASTRRAIRATGGAR